VLCLPSITARNGDAEGFGLVLLEAQACGVPVVTSARGGATDGMINGVTGLAFDEGDVTALTGHLVKLLTDDTMAMAMSRAGPEFVAAKFDLRRCTADLEDLYDSMV
jgi:glycosyltransferase involved in cell wall biosynthesis